MDAKTLITEFGGRQKVMAMTGLSKGRISQWVTTDEIPLAWLRFFKAKRPRLDLDRLETKVINKHKRKS